MQENNHKHFNGIKSNYTRSLVKFGEMGTVKIRKERKLGDHGMILFVKLNINHKIDFACIASIQSKFMLQKEHMLPQTKRYGHD